MKEIKKYGDYGLVSVDGNTVLSFNILKSADQQTIEQEKSDMQNTYLHPEIFKLKDYNIASYGLYNNMPGQLRDLIKNNHLLPEILAKQVRFMYGMGVELFTSEIIGKKKIKTPLERKGFEDVWRWLQSWKQNGLADDHRTYLKRVIREYYYTEGYFSKWMFNKSRRIGGKLPVRGLEYVPSVRGRLGTANDVDFTQPIEDEMLELVMYGTWDRTFSTDYDVYDRFDTTEPFKFPVAINYTRDFGFGEEVYSFPTFYYGLKEWILGSNINPKYINSYLKNSLNAKLHVMIPEIWVRKKIDTLQSICEHNRDREQAGTPLQTTYEGLTEIGTIFNYSMIQKLIDLKLKELTNVLSGSGENQGKTFVSMRYRTENGIEEWEFKEIPVKYKEFVDSILTYDKRAVEVILQGKGLDPSISNVSKDGIFQSSGSNSYYNYLIYLNSLYYAEEFITSDINLALWLNFPRLKRDNITLGFMRNVPERQEELKPDERIEKTT